jgi:hypothetical protein
LLNYSFKRDLSLVALLIHIALIYMLVCFLTLIFQAYKR